jgi:hypothetical protein
MKDLFKYLKDSDELTLIKVVFLLWNGIHTSFWDGMEEWEDYK